MEINNEPSYVFKTSDLALQLALKMDTEIQNDKTKLNGGGIHTLGWNAYKS